LPVSGCTPNTIFAVLGTYKNILKIYYCNKTEFAEINKNYNTDSAFYIWKFSL
jgi:hypothetical protein